MRELSDYELNEHYKTIKDLGYEVSVKTYKDNRGVMNLVDSLTKKSIYNVEIKTNGRGTSRIMQLLPTTRPLTHLDIALSSLAKFAEDYEATVVRSLSLPRRLNAKTFTSVLNEVTRKHGSEAYEKVLERLSVDPKTPFSTLIQVYSSELVNIVSGQEQLKL
jgi:hypothetical protein